ncbi:MAG TPA: transposase, partial [Urbifossiella sp.]|nr:transposase [Urbifossiella sp.]
MPPNAPIDGPAGCLPHVERIAARIRRAWPGVEVVLRADRGVCRAYLMRWCEAHRIGFVFGRTKNARLRRVM